MDLADITQRPQEAKAVLKEFAQLFYRARRHKLDDCQFVGGSFNQGPQLYSVGATLRCVERELKEIGDDLVYPEEALMRDLANILICRSEWDRKDDDGEQ